jgi:hypothetical protein
MFLESVRDAVEVQDSVHPAASDDASPWRDDDMTGNGASRDHGATCTDATRAMHTAGADDGICLQGAQSDQACCQR